MPTIAKNSRAYYDYDIKNTFDAGLVLTGPEVKSAKSGNVSLAGSYVSVGPKDAHLISAHIGSYKYAPSEGYDPTHSRKLLLNKHEINGLLGKEKGLTIIPLEIYVGRSGRIKLKIGLGRGRKKQDKRAYIKKRDALKEARAATNG